MAWRHKCTIAWFNNSEAKNLKQMYLLPGNPAAKEVYKALAQGGLCAVKALGIEGVGAHVLAWCSRRYQMYGEQDYCG